jgi:translocator protein
MKSVKLLRLFTSLFICFAAAAIGSAFTMSQITIWYAGLNKPPFNPPNWIFGPVWTILYICMAVALYMVWSAKAKTKRMMLVRQNGILFFFVQLICNSLWSIIFFGLHAPLAAFIVILALWIFIVFTIQNFSVVTKTAGQLLIPYLAWVSFASILNFAVVVLN